VDGKFALIGTCLSNSCNRDGFSAIDDYELDKPNGDDDLPELNETKPSVHVPSVCFIDLYKLEVKTMSNFLTYFLSLFAMTRILTNKGYTAR
jgi:hypothetical protein